MLLERQTCKSLANIIKNRGRAYAGMKKQEQYCSAIKKNEIMPFVAT